MVQPPSDSVRIRLDRVAGSVASGLSERMRVVADGDAADVILLGSEATPVAARVAEHQRQAPEVPVLIVGPCASPRDVVRAVQAGAIDWIQAGSASTDELQSRIVDVVARARVRAEGRSIVADLTRRGEEHELDRRDLAERVRALAVELEKSHAELRDRVDQLGMLYRIGRDLSVQRNWDEALASLLDKIVGFLGAEGAAILLYSQSGRRLAPRRAHALAPDQLRRASELLIERPADLERGGELVSLESIEAGAPVRCRELDQPWTTTVLPLLHQSEALGHLLLVKPYADHEAFEFDRYFLITVQAILAEEVRAAQAMNELRRLRDFHARILDRVGSAVLTLDADGHVRFANATARELLGADARLSDVDARLRVGSERLGLGGWVHDLEPGEQRVAEGWLDVEASEPIPLSLLAMQLPTEHPGETAVLLVMEDMRERRALEAERRRAARQDELLIMAAEWAHDVRTPLTGILHGSELLADALEPEHTARRHFDMIRGEVERIDTLVANFLDFARPAQIKATPGDLRALLVDAGELLGPPAMARDLEFEVDTSAVGEAAMARIDADLVKQVLLNLITNAFDASPAKGRVRLSLQHRAEAPQESHAADVDGAWVVEVSDGGEGVPAAHIDRLFIPFFTTKPTGTGLGLAISDKVARAHQGHLRYFRREDRTVFEFVLPALITADPKPWTGDAKQRVAQRARG